MNTRVAALDDIEIVSAMYRDFYAYHDHSQPDFYKEAIENGKYPEYVIRSETQDFLITIIDDNIAGFIHVSENERPPYAWIPHRFAVCVDLFVFPPHRKKGIGTKLIAAAKEWAKNRNLDYIELSVRPENESAGRLYTQEGFQTISYTMRYPL